VLNEDEFKKINPTKRPRRRQDLLISQFKYQSTYLRIMCPQRIPVVKVHPARTTSPVALPILMPLHLLLGREILLTSGAGALPSRGHDARAGRPRRRVGTEADEILVVVGAAQVSHLAVMRSMVMWFVLSIWYKPAADKNEEGWRDRLKLRQMVWSGRDKGRKRVYGNGADVFRGSCQTRKSVAVTGPRYLGQIQWASMIETKFETQRGYTRN
jgi:hypothetical protein